MIKNTSISSLLTATVLVLSIAGCATTGTNSHQNNESANVGDDVSYAVKPGDRLGDIALRLTGQISNWQAIAAHNNIDDPRTLAAGQTILIPGDLLNSIQPINTQTAQSISTQTETLANAAPSSSTETRAPLPVTTGNGVSVARSRASVDDQASAIAVFPVEVNRSFDLQPIDTTQLPDSDSARFDSNAPKVRVIGTYYPKGIYAEPANYARLIRRVAPGTLFQLEREVNDWYKIVTDDGVAYIRRSDSTLAE